MHRKIINVICKLRGVRKNPGVGEGSYFWNYARGFKTAPQEWVIRVRNFFQTKEIRRKDLDQNQCGLQLIRNKIRTYGSIMHSLMMVMDPMSCWFEAALIWGKLSSLEHHQRIFDKNTTKGSFTNCVYQDIQTWKKLDVTEAMKLTALRVRVP